MTFADYGAEVIRVEPAGGDELRVLGAVSVWWRGQKSVTEGQSGLRNSDLTELCHSADVVLDTSRTWSAKSFTYGPPVPAHQVYCLLTAEPHSVKDIASGVRPREAAYSEVIEARYGFMHTQDGHRDGPTYLGWPHAVYGAAWLMELGVTSALHERARSGRGQILTTSLVDGLAALNSHRWISGGSPHLEPWPAQSSLNRLGNSTAIMALLQCADGKWIQIQTGATGAVNKFFELLGRHDLVDAEAERRVDCQFASQEIADQFWASLPGIFKMRTVQQWLDVLTPIGVAAMPALDVGAALYLEQVRKQGLVRDAGGRVEFGLGVRFARTPGKSGGPAPGPGEHNREFKGTRGPSTGAATSRSTTIGPLAGTLVLDLGANLAGPFATRLLADLGARVIKVESVGPRYRFTYAGSSVSINRGKESLAVDLKREAGRRLIIEFVKRADIIYHNLRFGVMERLGLDFKAVRRLNVRAIYCHSSGYGNEGPWRTLPAFAPQIDAVSGLLARTGGAGNPPMHYVTHADYSAALHAAPKVVAALFARDVTGKAQYLEVPQLAAAMFGMSDVYAGDGVLEETFRLDASQGGHSAGNALYRTLDDWIVIACYSEIEWSAAHTALGIDTRESYRQVRARGFRPEDARSGIAGVLSELETSEALARLEGAGVACARPTPAVVEALLDGKLAELDVLISHDASHLGRVFEVGHTIRFAASDFHHRRPAPRSGEHTRSLLREVGVADEEINDLMAQGVIGVDEFDADIAATTRVPEPTTDLRVGTRLRGVVCTTELVVIRSPSVPVAILCCGEQMVPLSDSTGNRPLASPALASRGNVAGKRYVHPGSGLEVLCTKSGSGPLSVGDELLETSAPKPLPSAD